MFRVYVSDSADKHHAKTSRYVSLTQLTYRRR